MGTDKFESPTAETQKKHESLCVCVCGKQVRVKSKGRERHG